MVGLRSGGSHATVKQDVICTCYGHLRRVEGREYTERGVCRRGNVGSGAGWASLSNAIKPEARGIDYVRAEGMSLRNRHETVAGCRVDNCVVVIIRRART